MTLNSFCPSNKYRCDLLENIRPSNLKYYKVNVIAEVSARCIKYNKYFLFYFINVYDSFCIKNY